MLAGYFLSKTGTPDRAPGDFNLEGVAPAERRRLAWHLPDDFNRRTRHGQAEILDWVRTVIISGSTDYPRYQAAMMRHRYAVRFYGEPGPRRASSIARMPEESGIILAPQRLNDEMSAILTFKTATFAAIGLQRNGVWGTDTAARKVEPFGLWFGAFAAPPESEVQGSGVDPELLTFAMMIFPQVWDWYLSWRERRLAIGGIGAGHLGGFHKQRAGIGSGSDQPAAVTVNPCLQTFIEAAKVRQDQPERF